MQFAEIVCTSTQVASVSGRLEKTERLASCLKLRFARVKRYRPDKAATEADTIDAVRGSGIGGQGSG